MNPDAPTFVPSALLVPSAVLLRQRDVTNNSKNTAKKNTNRSKKNFRKNNKNSKSCNKKNGKSNNNTYKKKKKKKKQGNHIIRFKKKEYPPLMASKNDDNNNNTKQKATWPIQSSTTNTMASDNKMDEIPCCYCEDTFFELKDLKAHSISAHQGRKCFYCSVCNTVFSQIPAKAPFQPA